MDKSREGHDNIHSAGRTKISAVIALTAALAACSNPNPEIEGKRMIKEVEYNTDEIFDTNIKIIKTRMRTVTYSISSKYRKKIPDDQEIIEQYELMYDLKNSPKRRDELSEVLLKIREERKIPDDYRDPITGLRKGENVKVGPLSRIMPYDIMELTRYIFASENDPDLQLEAIKKSNGGLDIRLFLNIKSEENQLTFLKKSNFKKSDLLMLISNAASNKVKAEIRKKMKYK